MKPRIRYNVYYMKVFISWATDEGLVSKAFATALHAWLPNVIQAVEPWMSAEDLTPGKRWNEGIQTELNETAIGIFCLTQDGQYSQWLSFEAGALAKTVTDSNYVIPILLSVPEHAFDGPLKAFQSISTSKSDMEKLVATINKALSENGKRNLSKERLKTSFDRAWTELEEAIQSLPKTEQGKKPKQSRQKHFEGGISQDKLLDSFDEILKLARDTNTTVNQLLSINHIAQDRQREIPRFPRRRTYTIYPQQEDIGDLNGFEGYIRPMLEENGIEVAISYLTVEATGMQGLSLNMFGPNLPPQNWLQRRAEKFGLTIAREA